MVFRRDREFDQLFENGADSGVIDPVQYGIIFAQPDGFHKSGKTVPVKMDPIIFVRIVFVRFIVVVFLFGEQEQCAGHQCVKFIVYEKFSLAADNVL